MPSYERREKEHLGYAHNRTAYALAMESSLAKDSLQVEGFSGDAVVVALVHRSRCLFLGGCNTCRLTAAAAVFLLHESES